MTAGLRAPAALAQIETCEARPGAARAPVGFVLRGRAAWAGGWPGRLADLADAARERLVAAADHAFDRLAGRGRAEAALWRELAGRLAAVASEGDLRALVVEAAARLCGVGPAEVELIAAGGAGVDDRRLGARSPDDDGHVLIVRHAGRDLAMLRVAARGGRRRAAEARRRLEALGGLAAVAWAALREAGSIAPRGARHGGRDEATGLPDARAFDALLQSAVEGARRARGKLAILVIRPVRIDDIRADDGSVFADAAIGLAARATRATVRASDPVARLDDDALAVLLPGASETNARRVADAVRAAIAEAGQTASTPTPLTAAVGVASYPGPATTAEALMAAARRALSLPEPEPQPA